MLGTYEDAKATSFPVKTADLVNLCVYTAYVLLCKSSTTTVSKEGKNTAQ